MSGCPKVLWLTKGLGRGGAEQLIRLSAPHLRQGGFRVEVAYVLPWKNALAPDIQGMGVPVHCLGRGRVGRLAWVGRLRRFVRSRDFDIVHSHSPVPAVAARLALAPDPPVLVHTEHNVWHRYRWPTQVANSITYARNAAVFAVSDGVRDSVRRPVWMPRRSMPFVETLHHGIDDQLVHSGSKARRTARAVLGLAADEFVIGSVGNFTPKKDQRTLMMATRILADGGLRPRLVLVGTGPLEGELRRQAHHDGLADRVLFTGTRSDVQTILPAFDVFALSSLHEGLPIALLEAMAAGVACVATRVGGIPEALTDGRDGFVVPPSDPGALATALAKIGGDRELSDRMGAAAASRSRDFSITRAVQRMEDVYEQLLDQAGAR